MGHHYVPRYYLRGFSPNFGSKVWAYDLEDRRKFCSNIINVGQENNLYSDELEGTLSENVEGPANEVLDKIRNHEELTPEDRSALSLYLVTLWKRVPEGKRRLRQRMPEISSEIGDGIHSEIDRIISEQPEYREIGLRRKQEVDEILSRYVKNPLDEIWFQVIMPDSTPRMAQQVSSMNWSFFYTEDRHSFLTCDNPVFFFSSLGIGNPNSELSVPISSQITLWATNRQASTADYYPASKAIVKELGVALILIPDAAILGAFAQKISGLAKLNSTLGTLVFCLYNKLSRTGPFRRSLHS